MTESEALAALRDLPTPNLSDALDELGLSGTMSGIGPLAPDLPRMVGRARTVLQGPRPAQADPHVSYAAHVALADSEVGPGEVIVIGIVGGRPASSWGALLSLRCQAREASGTVIDGPVRDPAEIIRSGYPVFTRADFCPAGSKLRLGTLGVDVPVPCGGVQVAPGDFVVGDDSGVVVIPPARAAEVIDIARRIMAAEQDAQTRIASGGKLRPG